MRALLALWPSCIIPYSLGPDVDSEMALPGQFRDRVRLSSSIRAALVVVAICSLTVSLATRYTVPTLEGHNERAVKSQSSDAKRQHLLGDGLRWTAPAPSLAFFEPPRTCVPVVSAVVQSTNLCSESWLYNRPPPAC